MLSDNLSPNTLRPIFSNALSLKLETIKLDAFIQNYSAGQTLPGKVVQVLPEQKAVVELQGERLLLQFSRPVNPGQKIAISIEQIHPSPVLKLTELSSLTSSQKTAPGNSAREALPLNPQGTDKTSIQNRPADSLMATPAPDSKKGQAALDSKDLLTKADLKRLGIEAGQKGKAEVLRVVDRETLQVRINSNAVTIKHASAQKLQPGDLISLHTRSIASGKFMLEVEPMPGPFSNLRPPLDSSVLKNYLPTRQPLIQVLAGLKEIFLKGPLNPVNELNIDPGQLKQLQANLQKIVSVAPKAPDAVQLKEIVDRSGFHYEAKVKDFLSEPGLSNKNALLENDLKGQLMRLSRQLEQFSAGTANNAASDKFIGKLMTQVNQAVSNIELLQLTHHFSKEEHHPLLVQLPENLMGDEDRFKIYVFPDQREDTGPDHDFHNRIFNLVFLLNLSALGDLRIETRIFKDEISIHIAGSNSEAVRFIEAHVPELEDSFQKEGFSISVTSRHQTEVSMEVPDSLGQLLV
ncbi:MAG: flagellar hook-length control protein FliK, partial [Nitrospinota bacterium]|nr:flagellar hook-length control protein FliK [Nitrospinota bacterium]